MDVSLLLIINLGYWKETLETLALVVTGLFIVLVLPSLLPNRQRQG